MKNLDLSSMGVREMNTLEMQETDGGLIGWLILGAVALLVGTTSCSGNNMNFQFGGQNNTIQNTQTVDSSFNGVTADSTFNGNSVSVPIQP